MLTIYGVANSRSSRVLWALEEAGAEYNYRSLDFKAGEHHKPEYLALSPEGKVPALVDGDFVLTESAAIVNYVANRYAPQLLPATPEQKAKYDQWCFFALAELEQGLWTMGKHKFALPGEHRVPAIQPTAAFEFQKALNSFSLGLGDKPYILGDEFSAVDILLAHTLEWGEAFRQPIAQANLQAYKKRCLERDAFKAAVAREN